MSQRPSWFSRIDLSRCAEYFDEVEEFASQTGRLEEFYALLKRLAHGDIGDGELTMWGRPVDDFKVFLFKDFAPYSFEFSQQAKYRGEREYSHLMQGGMIFHGAHDRGGDGGAPTFSVNLSPHDGWSIHT